MLFHKGTAGHMDAMDPEGQNEALKQGSRISVNDALDLFGNIHSF